MKRRFSILLIMMCVLVVAHAIVPHHHHHDRIYLLMEENHENHKGHSQDEDKCHHGTATAEVLVCASKQVSLNAPEYTLHIELTGIAASPTLCLQSQEFEQELNTYLGNWQLPQPLLPCSKLRGPPAC